MSEKKKRGYQPRSGQGGGPMGPGGAPEKAKDFKKTWKELLSYTKSGKKFILIPLILATFCTVITLVGPPVLSDITNTILEGLMTEIDLDAIFRLVAIVGTLYVISLIVGYVQGYIMTTMTHKISKQMRTDISEKINKLPLKYYDGTTVGDTLSIVTNDVDTIELTMNQSLGMLFSAVTLLIGCVIMMFSTNVILTLTALVSTVLGFIFMTFILKTSQKYFGELQENLGVLNGHVEEVYTGHNVVKVYNATKKVTDEFNQTNNKMYDSAWKSQFLSGLMMPVMMFVGNFGYVAVCVVGGTLVINGSIDFGTIVAFMVYVRLFSQPLSQLAQAANSMQSTAAASERVFEFLSTEEMEDESSKNKTIEKVVGNVTFSDVCFGYNKDRQIVNNFSAEIKAGQKIAIVGPTGAGKTTIVNLLMRFYEIDSGDILIDGVPISSVSRETIHNLFCMVLQDTWLFEGTVRENIAYSKKDVTDKEIEDACKAAGIHRFIRNLPNGYDTVLNDKASLSVGQKQLMTIARAMVENAPMLILDEATSSVDTRTELQIQTAMDKLTVGRTSFVIAHRLSTIKNADVIFVMKDGDIIERGNHKELLDKNGFYAMLYTSQFEKTEEE